MFVLKTDHAFSWPVDVQVPADGGTYRTHRFDCTFRSLPQARIDRLLEGERTNDLDLLREVVVGWEHVQDEAGASVPFGPEALERLLDLPFARIAMLRAYFDAVGGGARRKN